MTSFGEITFKGASGREYGFKSFPLNTEFKEFGGVYLITWRHPVSAGIRAGQTAIFVGRTDNMSVVLNNHSKMECFNQHKANCVCIHHEDEKNKRKITEMDLIVALNPPCNTE